MTKKISKFKPGWWRVPVTPAPGKLRRKDCEFEASLGFTITSYCKIIPKSSFLNNFHQSGVEYLMTLSIQNFKCFQSASSGCILLGGVPGKNTS